MTSSLVIQTSFLGDAILTTPLIAELATRGPVDVVTTPNAAPLLANNPAIREIFPFAKRGADAGPLGLWRFARKLSARSYDAAYLAQGSHRSGALARMAGVRERIGFDSSSGRVWYTRHVRHDRSQHHAERLWRLAAGNDAPAPTLRPQLFPGAADRAAADALLRNVPHDGATLVALAPGSIWGTKRWPHFPELAARIAPLHRIVVLGSADDAPLAAAIVAAAGASRVLDTTGQLTLLGSAALLARCAALVTNDSAPLHLASATDTPTVAIFGPTVPAFGFGPLAARRATVGLDTLSCRPCDSHGPHKCPLGHWQCMRDLPVQRLVDSVVELTATR